MYYSIEQIIINDSEIQDITLENILKWFML